MEIGVKMKKYAKAIYWGLPISLILAISIILHLGWINAFDNFFEGLVHIVPNLKGLMLKITLDGFNCRNSMV